MLQGQQVLADASATGIQLINTFTVMSIQLTIVFFK
jgi:hypothetical protein